MLLKVAVFSSVREQRRLLRDRATPSFVIVTIFGENCLFSLNKYMCFAKYIYMCFAKKRRITCVSRLLEIGRVRTLQESGMLPSANYFCGWKAIPGSGWNVVWYYLVRVFACCSHHLRQHRTLFRVTAHREAQRFLLCLLSTTRSRPPLLVAAIYNIVSLCIVHLRLKALKNFDHDCTATTAPLASSSCFSFGGCVCDTATAVYWSKYASICYTRDLIHEGR